MLEAVAVEIPNTGGSGVVVLRVPASRRKPHRLQSNREVYIRREDESVKIGMRQIQELAIQSVAEALEPCRECGACISIEAQTCPHCGAPHPTKDKSAAPDPTNAWDRPTHGTRPRTKARHWITWDRTDKSAAPDPIKGKASWWMSAGIIFSLAVVAIIVGWSLRSAPPVPPVPHKEETIDIDAIIHSLPYLNSQGNEYLANKQYDLAIQKFDEAISLGDTKLYDSRGMAWLAKHEYERAIADFTQAAKIEHGNYLIYIHRAEANEQKGDRDDAIADYRRALGFAPEKTISDQIKATLKRLDAKR
jgi:tetratricopeptide (TPR) repeat protein